jgi:hypothetical protein
VSGVAVVGSGVSVALARRGIEAQSNLLLAVATHFIAALVQHRHFDHG